MATAKLWLRMETSIWLISETPLTISTCNKKCNSKMVDKTVHRNQCSLTLMLNLLTIELTAHRLRLHMTTMVAQVVPKWPPDLQLEKVPENEKLRNYYN